MYNTEQRRILTDFFADNRERAMTVEEAAEGVASYCTERGIAAPGKSTVYRLVSKLCAEEVLRRFAREDKRFVYQLAACPEEVRMAPTPPSSSRILSATTSLVGFWRRV